ncbi:MAG: Peptidase [Phenylobacterium sp.]|nr:Peptidase [Phenylobacterium sp.]MDB5442949.1 Peptidase [Phenylobacterium sp.]MDB5495772.1 Peptidase [Phenylobacterium sp.]
MKLTPLLLAAGLAAGASAALAAQPAFTGHELSGQAKVSLDQARTIALKARPGQITDQELEKEKGGTGLRYSFDVKVQKAVYEVGVDARTGKLLENKKEGPHPD